MTWITSPFTGEQIEVEWLRMKWKGQKKRGVGRPKKKQCTTLNK